MAVKQVKFAATAELCEIVDSGDDDYTFDNFDENGVRRVKQFSKKRLGPPPRRTSSAAATIWAHFRATNWVTGGRCDLPEAHIIGHSGRCPQFAVGPDGEDDVLFVMDQEVLARPYSDYTFK